MAIRPASKNGGGSGGGGSGGAVLPTVATGLSFGSVGQDADISYGDPIVTKLNGKTYNITGVRVTDFKWVQNSAVLTSGNTLDLGNIQCWDVYANSNGVPSTISNFTTLTGAELIVISNSSASTSFGAVTTNLPKLEAIAGGLTVTSAVTSLSVPKLTYIGGTFSATTNYVYSQMTALTTVGGLSTNGSTPTNVTVPALVTCIGDVNMSLASSLVTLSLPSLKYCYGDIKFPNTTGMTTFNLPVLEVVKNWTYSFSSTPYFPLPTSLKRITGNVNYSRAMSQAQVDEVLAKLVSLDGTAGTTLYNSGIVTLNFSGSSAPSATGLTNKSTLVARGVTVNTL